jgi:hypothetical protein
VLSRDPDQRYDSAADLRAALLDTGLPPAAPQAAPAPALEEPADEQDESFARSERGWLVPALFILLIATAITVAGLLLRETGIGSGDAPATTGSTLPVTSEPVPISEAIPFDPQGRGEPGENDQLAPGAIDEDPTTAWRTEAYDTPDFFGSKTGVGLGLVVGAPTEALELTVEGSTNGWGGRLFVLDAAQLADGLEGVDPDELEPDAVLEDVRAPVTIELGGRELAEGDVLLLWITNLGEPVDGGRHRVEISQVGLVGRPPGG